MNTQYSGYVSGTVGAIFIGSGVGANFGISMGNHWYDVGQWQYFYSGQYNQMTGLGAYVGAGGGVSGSDSNGSLPPGDSTDVSPYGEFDWFNYGASGQGDGKCLSSISAAHPKIGVGVGVWEGIGTSITWRHASPTVGQAYQFWLFDHSGWLSNQLYNWF